MKIEKVHFFELSNGKIVKVSELSETFKAHVDVLNRLRKDAEQKQYELNVYASAYRANYTNIQNALEAMYVVGTNNDAVSEDSTTNTDDK